jgi:hypothetical protein
MIKMADLLRAEYRTRSQHQPKAQATALALSPVE